MNYEEKYKSALEWMRSIYPTMQEADKEDAEHYFPELRESKDERIRKEIIELVHFFYCSSSVYEHHVPEDDMIAWLEKRGENHFEENIEMVNPSWSEEDKKMLDRIIDCIDGTGLLDFDQIDWLKSIKPNHWKPSEEQMKAIKYFIDFHRPQANASTEGWNEFKYLESLYNDIKNFES